MSTQKNKILNLFPGSLPLPAKTLVERKQRFSPPLYVSQGWIPLK